MNKALALSDLRPGMAVRVRREGDFGAVEYTGHIINVIQGGQYLEDGGFTFEGRRDDGEYERSAFAWNPGRTIRQYVTRVDS